MSGPLEERPDEAPETPAPTTGGRDRDRDASAPPSNISKSGKSKRKEGGRDKEGRRKEKATAPSPVPSSSSSAHGHTRDTPKETTGNEEHLRLEGEGLESLPPRAVFLVLTTLAAPDLCSLSLVSSSWSSSLSADVIWRDLFLRRFPEAAQVLPSPPHSSPYALTTARDWRGAFRVRLQRVRDPLGLHVLLPAAPVRGVPPRTGWEKELLQWVGGRVGRPVEAVTAEVLLQLVHSLDATLLDLHALTSATPERQAASALHAAEEGWGIVPVLEGRDVAEGSERKALALWLTLLRAQADPARPDPAHDAKAHLARTRRALGDYARGLEAAEAHLDEAVGSLGGALAQQDGGAERAFLDARAALHAQMLSQALGHVNTLEERNRLLQQQNRLLSERLSSVERALRLEETTRRKLEEQLEVEERVRALGEVLQDRDAHEYLGLFEKDKDRAHEAAK